MSLLNPNTKSGAVFETDEDGVITEKVGTTTEKTVIPADNSTVEKVADSAVDKPADTSKAVTVQKTRALVASTKLDTKVLDSLKDSLHVDYNTLIQIIASNGNFMDRETDKVLGDTVVFDLLSYQDSFVVSPGDDKAPDDLVRYSEDGIICSDGTLVEDHLKLLRLDWPKAALKKRTVVVGAIENAVKTQEYNGVLVQFDLSPTSKVQYDRYRANTAYQLAKGVVTPEQVTRIKATAELAKNGDNVYTVAKFAIAP